MGNHAVPLLEYPHLLGPFGSDLDEFFDLRIPGVNWLLMAWRVLAVATIRRQEQRARRIH
jgi:polyphosphate kinase